RSERRRRPAEVILEVGQVRAADAAADGRRAEASVAVRDADVAEDARLPKHERAARWMEVSETAMRASRVPVRHRRRVNAAATVRVFHGLFAVMLVGRRSLVVVKPLERARAREGFG